MPKPPKLTPEQKKHIKEAYDSTDITMEMLADFYEVGETTIYRCVHPEDHWNERNKEKMNTYCREYNKRRYHEDPVFRQKMIDSVDKWKKKNRDKVRGYDKKQRDKHKEKLESESV